MRLYVGIGITYTALASVFDEEIYRRIPRHSAQCLIWYGYIYCNSF